MENKKNLLVIGGAALAVVLLLAGAYYLGTKNKSGGVVNIADDTDAGIANGPVATTAVATKTLAVAPKSNTVAPVVAKAMVKAVAVENCYTTKCFDDKFLACEPATITAESGYSKIYARIIGPSAGGCKVSGKYLASTHQNWINKEMTCVLNNKRGFLDTFQNAVTGVIGGTVVCNGSLYSELRATK